MAGKTKKELEQEIEQLKTEANARPVMDDFDSEFAKVAQMAKGTGGMRIPFKEHTDHPGVTLYTALNKKIGPLHPNNAKSTMERFKAKGFVLYTQPRTPAQIEAYKETDFYKSEHKKHVDTRKKRAKMFKTKRDYDDLARSIAKETALAIHNK